MTSAPPSSDAEFDPEDLPDRPPPPPPPPPPAPPPPDSWAPRAPRLVSGAVEAGVAWQSLYLNTFVGGSLDGLLTVDLGDLSVGGTMELVESWTDDGLASFALRAGVVVERRIDRLRLGGGARLGGIEVRRATDDTALSAVTAGVFGRLSFDVARFGSKRGAVYLVAKGSVDLDPQLNYLSVGALYGVSGGVGVRF